MCIPVAVAQSIRWSSTSKHSVGSFSSAGSPKNVFFLYSFSLYVFEDRCHENGCHYKHVKKTSRHGNTFRHFELQWQFLKRIDAR
jgi:hypothetical protein